MIEEMVKAHLENVKNVIADLEQQKTNIDTQIIKLNNYLQRGMLELNNFKSSVAEEASVNSSNVNVNNQYFLGE